MKRLNLFLWCIFTIPLFGQPNYLLKFELATDSPNFFEADIFIAGSETFDLGSSNLVFEFDESDFANPSINVLTPTTLLSSALYNVSLTEPKAGNASLNIELLASDIDDVTIPMKPIYEHLVRIRLDKLNPDNKPKLTWLYNGGTTETVVFLDDETTQIFINSPVDDIIDLDLNFAPVELLRFDAFASTHASLLHWESATEINFEGYEVQRSTDGVRFEKIAWVEGQGDETTGQSYQLEDKEVRLSQLYYYRLKIIDVDETFEFSPIRVVKFGETEIIVTIYPNPAKDHFNLSVVSLEEGAGELIILDTKGSEVRNYGIDLNIGPNEILIPIDGLAKGNYLIQGKVKSQSFSNKLTKY